MGVGLAVGYEEGIRKKRRTVNLWGGRRRRRASGRRKSRDRGERRWEGRGTKKMKKNEGGGGLPSDLWRMKGEGRVWLGAIRVVFDYLQPKLVIVYYFNLNPLKPASNLLNLQNILGFTIPSYFKFLNCLVNYLHTHYSKFPKYPKNHQKFVKIPKFQISPFIISQNTL